MTGTRMQPLSNYADTETVTITYGETDYTCNVITKKNRIMCPVDDCYKRFTKPADVKQHMNRSHGKRPTFKRLCAHCDDPFTVNTSISPEQEYCSEDCVRKGVIGDLDRCSCGWLIARGGVCKRCGEHAD